MDQRAASAARSDGRAARGQIPGRRCADGRGRVAGAAALQRAALRRSARGLSDVAQCRGESEQARRLCGSPPRPPAGASMNRVESINRGMSDMKPLESVDIPPMKDMVSAEE